MSKHSLQNTEEEPIRRWNDRSRNRRTHEVPFIAACSHFTRKNTRFRAPASSPTQAPCNSHAAIRNSEDCFPTSFEYWISLPCLRLNFRFHQNFIGCPCLASARRRFPTVGAAQTPRWCDGYQSRCQTSQPRGMLMMLDIPWDLIF